MNETNVKDIPAIDMENIDNLKWANEMLEISNHVLAADNERLKEEVERLRTSNAILKITLDNLARGKR